MRRALRARGRRRRRARRPGLAVRAELSESVERDAPAAVRQHVGSRPLDPHAAALRAAHARTPVEPARDRGRRSRPGEHRAGRGVHGVGHGLPPARHRAVERRARDAGRAVPAVRHRAARPAGDGASGPRGGGSRRARAAGLLLERGGSRRGLRRSARVHRDVRELRLHERGRRVDHQRARHLHRGPGRAGEGRRVVRAALGRCQARQHGCRLLVPVRGRHVHRGHDDRPAGGDAGLPDERVLRRRQRPHRGGRAEQLGGGGRARRLPFEGARGDRVEGARAVGRDGPEAALPWTAEAYHQAIADRAVCPLEPAE